MFKRAGSGNALALVQDQSHREVKEEPNFSAGSKTRRLFAVEDVANFKRILSADSDDATIHISSDVRKHFVALDMGERDCIVVVTPVFRADPRYRSYLLDLARAHIKLVDEAEADEGVISDIYNHARMRKSIRVDDDTQAIGFFRDVMETAHVQYGTSDAHIEVRFHRNDAELRFRVDGDLPTYQFVPRETVRRALAATYLELTQRNTNSGTAFQESVAQSAMVPLTFKNKKVNLRWQSIPMGNGYDVILRLLDGHEENHSVLMPDKMGLESSQLTIINRLGQVSGGVSIFSGETGSAKSTLLRALSYMYMVAHRGLKKQYAVNMPSEYPMPWLSEQSIPRAIDESDEVFSAKVASIIRAWMRGDPDDLTVGEILDSVVAGLVIELALTGHPVRTTLHANSIIDIFMRLVGGRLRMAVDEVASEGLINAVGNQKLIPLLCENCKGEAEARKVMAAADLNLLEEKFGLDTSKMYCRFEPGCEKCRKPGLFTRFSEAGADKKRSMIAGTKGQTLAMELYQPTPEFLERVLVRDWNGARAVWRGERVSAFDDADMTGKTIYEHALYKASQGIIDPRSIIEMKPFELYRVMPRKGG